MVNVNLQIYEKTRWENILRHKKNKNYVVRLNVDGELVYQLILKEIKYLT